MNDLEEMIKSTKQGLKTMNKKVEDFEQDQLYLKTLVSCANTVSTNYDVLPIQTYLNNLLFFKNLIHFKNNKYILRI